MHKANIFVVDPGFNFQRLVLRHKHHELLCCVTTPDGMNGQLLHDAVNGRR